MAIVALLAWQQAAGWPGRMARHFERIDEGQVQVFRFPRNLAPEKWNIGLVRVIRDGRALPFFANEEAFEAGTIEGWTIRGKSVLIRVPTVAPAKGGPLSWTVLIPWSMEALDFLAVVCGAALFTAVLAWFRNPVTWSVFVRVRQWWLRPEPAWALALAVLVAAVLVRVCGFSYPGWENDSPSYFGSVFHVVDGGLPLATPDRPFAYPLVIGELLRIIPDLRAILILHMIASLVAAMAIGAVVWLAGGRLFESADLRSLCRFLGIGVFAAMALNDAILQREWALLSEAWVSFYLGIQVALVWVLTCRIRSLAASLGLFAALCLCGLLAFFTRANWGFALAFLPVPWVVVCFRATSSRRAFFGWAGVGAAVLLALTAATFGFQAFCKPPGPRPYLYDRARALVCWHVPLIQVEIERRLQAHPDEPSRAVLAELAQVLNDALERAKTQGSGSYPSLTFDPDELYFRGLASGPNFRALSIDDRTALCASLFKEGLRHHPEIFLGKVAAQMRLFFTVPYQRPSIFLPDVKLGIARSEKAVAVPEMPARFAAAYAPIVAKARREFEAPWPSPARLVSSIRSSLIFEILARLFTRSIFVPLLLCALCVGWRKWREAIDWRKLTPVVTVAFWSFGSAFLSALSSAVTQGLDVQRYIQLSIPLTLLAQALWPMIALSLLLALRRGRAKASRAVER